MKKEKMKIESIGRYLTNFKVWKCDWLDNKVSTIIFKVTVKVMTYEPIVVQLTNILWRYLIWKINCTKFLHKLFCIITEH